MTKVNPTANRAVAAGTVGLAALGAVAGAVGSAHAAELPGLAGGLPVSTNAVEAVRNLVVQNHGNVAGMPLKSIPVVGEVSNLLAAGGPEQGSPLGVLGALAGGPQTRGRAVQPAAMPGTVQGAQAAVQQAGQAAQAAPLAAPAAAPQAMPMAPAPQRAPMPQSSSPLDGVSGLTSGLPMGGALPLSGLESALPLGGQLAGPGGKGLPLVGGLTEAGGGGLFNSLGGLTGGLSHLG